MPYTLETLPEVPALIVHFSGSVDLPEFYQWWRDVAAATREIPGGRVYHIMDTRYGSASFADIIAQFEDDKLNFRHFMFPGKEFRLIFVGSNPLVDLVVEMMRQPQHGGITIPTFATLEEALIFLYTDWAQYVTQ